MLQGLLQQPRPQQLLLLRARHESLVDFPVETHPPDPFSVVLSVTSYRCYRYYPFRRLAIPSKLPGTWYMIPLLLL